jgi:hypothetical protein
MGKAIPKVWIQVQGSMRRPSPSSREERPMRPFALCQNLRAFWTRLARVQPRVRLTRLKYSTADEGVSEFRDSRAQEYYQDGWEDEEDERDRHFNRGLLGQLLSPLPASDAHLF